MFSDVDIGAWPYFVDPLVKFVSFLSSSHWSCDVRDLEGRGEGLSDLEVVLMFELWVGSDWSWNRLCVRTGRVDGKGGLSAHLLKEGPLCGDFFKQLVGLALVTVACFFLSQQPPT